MYKIGLNNFKGGGVGLEGAVAGTEFAVVVVCILFSMHFVRYAFFTINKMDFHLILCWQLFQESVKKTTTGTCFENSLLNLFNLLLLQLYLHCAVCLPVRGSNDEQEHDRWSS